MNSTVILIIVVAVVVSIFVAITISEWHFKHLIDNEQDEIIKDCSNHSPEKNVIPIDGKHYYAIRSLDNVRDML
jgi:hypothetical protein